jgi:molybdopterin converting factor small subunit
VATVRYFASAKAAAGRAQETIPAGTLEELLGALTDRYGERLALVMKASSYLVDGVSCRDLSTVVDAESTVDVLPPFAGG